MKNIFSLGSKTCLLIKMLWRSFASKFSFCKETKNNGIVVLNGLLCLLLGMLLYDIIYRPKELYNAIIIFF